jgi:FixJ family two-component response regulator
MNENNSVVCVIDDDSSTRESLRDLLRSAGLKVQTFSSAQEFLTGRPSENSQLPRARCTTARYKRS